MIDDIFQAGFVSGMIIGAFSLTFIAFVGYALVSAIHNSAYNKAREDIINTLERQQYEQPLMQPGQQSQYDSYWNVNRPSTGSEIARR